MDIIYDRDKFRKTSKIKFSLISVLLYIIIFRWLEERILPAKMVGGKSLRKIKIVKFIHEGERENIIVLWTWSDESLQCGIGNGRFHIITSHSKLQIGGCALIVLIIFIAWREPSSEFIFNGETEFIQCVQKRNRLKFFVYW